MADNLDALDAALYRMLDTMSDHKLTECDDVEITPEMIEAGRSALERWLLRWDYVAFGMPGDSEVDGLITSIFRSTSLANPDSSMNCTK